MKVTVIGSGYVGLVTAACLAEMGNDIFCLDVDQRKIDMLNQGQVPIHEPGLAEMIQRSYLSKKIIFSTDVEKSVDHGDIQFIAVGTPPDEDGSADLQYVTAAARNIARYMKSPKVIVDKSTVPVGTADRVSAVVASELKQRGADIEFQVLSNPEFLKEGAAIEDFMKPDRIIIGHNSCPAGLRAKSILEKLYAPFNRNHNKIMCMDLRSAELTKYAANAMLATRISFMNELANLADSVGADIEMVRQGIGSDTRIGFSFLYAGTGYGGSCFPKDVQALIRTGSEFGRAMKVLESVESVNNSQKTVLVEKIKKTFGSELRGKRFAIWGLAFKPNTDDMREAPSRYIIRELLNRGATVVAHDPIASQEALRALESDFADNLSLLEGFTFSEDPMTACDSADALLIITEWKAYRSPNFDALASRLKHKLIFDGRNMYDPHLMTELGYTYIGVGRSNFNSAT